MAPVAPVQQKPSFDELEEAAHAVIAIFKSMPEFSDARLAIIGGLSLWKYLKNFRTTDDVDFLMTVENAPNSVKEKLLALPSSPFEEQAQFFMFKSPRGKRIQIDITPKMQSPYVPTAAVPISTLQLGQLPYISELDLLVFKIYSCGLRATSQKKIRDANDAMSLLDVLASKGPVVLNPDQHAAVTQGLDDVVNISGMGHNWWKSRLGMK
ncbi:uncharacterized protein DSM5745_05078 [Aspergillus mulundensis]|uniref:Nucleotidyl transferase AbiEii toxin, Type IV TA system n=1 Tax=Aspergillus mulundensis TaxID=1810919 RepID=A0A3D8S631_9EURO|nr:Uncharacterized protein DSM5745_05078 [Aspergillus mulundensis]RDW81521.1 Uncharacterized protein DSM5745_05078 [Aspergillus mulundensis]